MVLSSCEVEYIVASTEACQAQWLNMLLAVLHLRKLGAMRLLVDNQSTIDLAKYLVAYGRSKHRKAKFHFLRDQVTKMKLKLEHCRSEDRLADLLPKPLSTSKFEVL